MNGARKKGKADSTFLLYEPLVGSRKKKRKEKKREEKDSDIERR